MVKLGILNSRMKDFHDIWLLSRQFDFDGNQLLQAMQLTFEQRGTSLTNEVVAFQAHFVAEKQVQWAAFYKRLGQEHLPMAFADIVAQVECFLAPVVEAACAGQAIDKEWLAAKGWL